MKSWKIITGAAVVISSLFGYGGYRYYLLDKELAATTILFESTVAEFENRVRELEDRTARLKKENEDLVVELIEQVGKNEQITSIVKDFEKLSKINPQLLQKYSKVYFLNENYVPGALAPIDFQYLAQPENPVEIHAQVLPYLVRLLTAAAADSAPLQIISGYRSFGEQSSLKSTYRVTYGAGSANKFSADQGYSEHQLGTTIDITTPDLGAGYTKFESALGYTWLTANAYRYGFVLSYPKNNAYYIFEPWHWRFVGVALATKLHDENKYFYELDQRTIDEYLIKIFD